MFIYIRVNLHSQFLLRSTILMVCENEYMNILPIIELTTAIGIFIGILMKNSVLKLRNCRVANFFIFFSTCTLGANHGRLAVNN